MKKKISSVIAAIMVALCIVLCFSACDFISYHASDSRENISYQATLEEKKAEYVSQLRLLASEDDFYDTELQLYRLQLIESVNKINECKEIEDLPALYHSCEEAILSIKTIADYKAEEAQMKAELENAKLDWISKLKALSTADDYREAEKISYEFYLDNGINAINACEDIEGLEDIFNAYSEVILSIKTAAQYESEELAAFVLYCNGKVKEIKDHVVLEDYRLEERDEVSALIDEYEAKILDVKDNDYTAVDNLVRDFKIKVYAIPTDSELYADELQQLKGQLINELQDMYKLSNYRDAEGAQVRDLLKLFEATIDTLAEKEDVLSQYLLIKSRLDSVKTESVLFAEERVNLIEELYAQLQDEIEKNIEEPEKTEFLTKAELVYFAMYDRVSLDGVRQEYRAFAQEIAYAALDILKDELNEYKNAVFYREKEQDEVNRLKKEYLAKFTDDLGVEGAKALLQEAKEAIDEVKTNDDLWNDSVIEFRTNLKELYGGAILEEPLSLTEANDYFELADIIDYYAFYQFSSTEFICDTFRVKLNFAHDDAWTELVNVYWYCELIRTAVGITSYFEDNSDYLVFQLIPYDFASVSNDCPPLNRLESVVEFDSDKSQMKVRYNDFDNFAYYKYGRTIKVWNSQQLWYALEHEYVPICETGSPAERVMLRAKEILREIIMEGMSDEEKIFQIYTWFGENCQYDTKYDSFYNSSDLVKLPDENISRLKSMHVEGALFEHTGICYSFAKANLLLLRLEGIETYYGFGKSVISDIAYTGSSGAGHGYNYVHLNSNWYMGDALRSFYQSRNREGISYLFLMLPAKDIYKNFTDRISKVNSDIWPLIENESRGNRAIYKKLIVDGNSIFIDSSADDKLSDKLYLFDNVHGESFSIICAPKFAETMRTHLEELYDVFYIKYIDSYIELFCKYLR